MSVMDDTLVLEGIDGSNPLGFLAALGTLRTLDRSAKTANPRLGWRLTEGAWRPFLETREISSRARLVEELHALLEDREGRPEFDLGQGASDLSVNPEAYREFAEKAARAASPSDRDTADFAAAFASEIHVDQKGVVRDTALRTMSGSGHQHFLGFMRTIIKETGPEHFEKTLFQEWRYDDPLKNRSLRWEPTEARLHAYQWNDPSKDPLRDKRGGVLGANRLAIEALPLLPTFPRRRNLVTTGFHRGKGRTMTWTWPIWRRPLPVRIVQSALALPEIRDRNQKHALRSRGIEMLFRSTRISSGYYRNFTMGVPILF